MGERIIENGYKITISRNRTHITTYENMVLQTTQPIKKDKPPKRKPTIPSNYAAFNYYNRMKKRRKAIDELCWNNFKHGKSCMVTLTFDTKDKEQQYTDYEKAYAEFKLFIKRINSHYDGFKYLATFSRQNNGNWHFHMICNLRKQVSNQMIAELWEKGYTYKTNLNTQEKYETAIQYLKNNMTESADALKNKKAYLYSRTLEHDREVTSWRKEDAEAFEKIFPIIEAANRNILYETRNHLGIKGEQVNDETGELFTVHIPDRELNPTLENAGYESWDTIYTHLTSSADFSNEFAPITTAAPKQKKFKRIKLD